MSRQKNCGLLLFGRGFYIVQAERAKKTQHGTSKTRCKELQKTQKREKMQINASWLIQGSQSEQKQQKIRFELYARCRAQKYAFAREIII